MIRVLQSREEIDDARHALRHAGLDFSDPRRLRFWRAIYRLRFRTPMAPADVLKSWDVWHAVRLIVAHCPDRRSPVLDMGCFQSEVLWALHASGYRDLWGCDLNPLCRFMPYWHRIHYRTADLTATGLPDGRFAAITCLSTVEHGVPVDALVAEARRLLRPGGLLILTTDFDGTGAVHDLDPSFRIFGQPWTILDPPALAALCERFLAAGFGWLDAKARKSAHRERPISWSGHDYTFVLVAFRRG